MYFDYESQIEDAVMDRLSNLNTTVQLSRFYESASPQELLNYVLGKVKSVPAVFVRCPGDSADSIDTEGYLYNTTYRLEIIIATNDHGKGKQIQGQRRTVNTLAATIMARLNGFKAALFEQPDAVIVYTGKDDLFTSGTVDARLLRFEVRGVVIDMNDLGLQTPMAGLNG